MAHETSRSQLTEAARQSQFLEVIPRDEATRRFQAALSLRPLGVEAIPLSAARGRVLAAAVTSDVDVPAFDRSNVDGFAVRAADTSGAMEEDARTLALNSCVLSPGLEPREDVAAGTATAIATGGMLPRGADAVVMIEDTDLDESTDPPQVRITRAVAPGQNITFAGTDISRGETVLWPGQVLTSREIGVLAAIGCDTVDVYRRPRVAVISTGDEIIAPGQPLRPGCVYDSNAHIIATAVEELGCEPVPCGSIPDDDARLQQAVAAALDCDAVILSGGTSKGAGDLSYRVVSRFDDPGIVAHGVALKPGKPICLAVTQGKPVVILPGFPTSAIFTFHEFVAPVLRALAGLPAEERASTRAVLPHRFHSERGRTEYVLVSLVSAQPSDTEPPDHHSPLTTHHSPPSLPTAYPLGKGSGSVTTFSLADGFVTIDQHTEIVEAGTEVGVTLLDRGLRPADLVVIGSHCAGLDLLLGELRLRGVSVKTIHVGSTGGLNAARRGECDIAGIHLMDPATGEYNRPLLTPELDLLPGYRRMQCVVFRRGDERFAGRSVEAAVRAALADPGCTMVNRNAGSGTRILIDRLLEGLRVEGSGLREGSSLSGRTESAPALSPQPLALSQLPGYAVQPKSHNAVAAAVAQGRADWGVCIETIARQYGLECLPLQDEHYDFVVPKSRRDRPAVRQFEALLAEPDVRRRLASMGFAD